MKSIFEELGGTYTLGEDGMYYPNLELPVEEEPHYGKYGRMRMNYIKEHRPGLYTELLFDGKLVSHLNDIDDTARQRMELLTRQMQEQHGVNEELKALDQMIWVGACNNIRNAAEEIVLNELIIANAKGESLYTSWVQVLSFPLNPSWTEVVLTSHQLVGKLENAETQILVKLL
ncbi:TnpV protein [Pilosibacter fragilis]|uniref:TnpV protein n=1 Tax=Pilosibacter fragilis TaxID=3078042 RepID=UPI003F57D49C